MGTILVSFSTQNEYSHATGYSSYSRVQCQAYMQQQQQQQTQSQVPPSSNPVTIAAPSQLYAQTGNKSQASSASATNPNSSTGVPPVSNRPNWMV